MIFLGYFSDIYDNTYNIDHENIDNDFNNVINDDDRNEPLYHGDEITVGDSMCNFISSFTS